VSGIAVLECSLIAIEYSIEEGYELASGDIFVE
jgi:hypothetical protein